MTDIGELTVRIKADASQLDTELKNVSGTAKQSADEMTGAFDSVKSALGTLGVAFSAGALIDFTKGALDAADSIYIMSQRTGIAADTLSALNVPLKQNGSSIEDFSNSVKFMSRNIELASQGNQQLINYFDQLGLSVTKLKSLTPEQQFFALAQAMSQVSDQGKFTADGMAIFGRGFSAIAPLIRTTGGNLQDFINKTEQLGTTLTSDEIAKVHEYNDAWTELLEKMKVKAVEATLAIHELANSQSQLRDEDSFYGVGGKGSAGKGEVSTERPSTVNMATFMSNDAEYPAKAYNPNYVPSAKGNNNDIASDEDGKDAAVQLQPFIDKLGEEAQAAAVSEKALYLKRTEMEADTKAQNDYTNGLRDTQTLTDQEKASVDAAASALYDHKEALQQNKQIADQLTTALTKIVMNFKDMKSAITDLFNAIAEEMIKTQVAKPLATSLTSALPTGGFASIFSGFGKILGFADGGSPPVGVPSMVGENGPELFVPNTAGTIIPNGSMGGQNIVVQQSFALNPGATEQTVAQLRNLAPTIAAQAHASVMQAIQKGGAASRIVGKRS